MKKEVNDTTIEDTRNLFGLKKKIIKNRIIKDIRKLFEHEEDYQKPVRIGNFWSNYYIEYEGSSGRNKPLTAKEYLKIKITIKIRYHT